MKFWGSLLLMPLLALQTSPSWSQHLGFCLVRSVHTVRLQCLAMIGVLRYRIV